MCNTLHVRPDTKIAICQQIFPYQTRAEKGEIFNEEFLDCQAWRWSEDGEAVRVEHAAVVTELI